jgi:peptide/nickel transport system ATP-binding protein
MTVATESTTTQDLALSVRDLTVSLPEGMERQHAVENLSFDLKRGQILCIIGESGSGKSITANAVMGLLPKVITVTGGAIELKAARAYWVCRPKNCAACAAASSR